MDDIYQQIIKECYWDSAITPKELDDIVKSNDTRELQKLFSKIIYNSSDKLRALQIFTKEQLEVCFKNFQVTYNHKYIQKHYKVLANLLLGKKYKVEGLEWQKS